MYLKNGRNSHWYIVIAACWYGGLPHDVWHIFGRRDFDLSDVESKNECGSLYVGF
jgi:hypothetical protein